MAPPRSGARKQAPREADYSNIGVAGRKTGIVLKDSGIRDEHGMEPIDGIFSSPEKTPSRRKRKSNLTNTSESEMEIDQTGAVPDPRDVLRPGRSPLPPPRSRSPMKTNLGTPARRSAGIMSSPSKVAGARHSAGRSSLLASDSPSRLRGTGTAPQRRVGLSRPPMVQQQPRPVKKHNFDLEVSEDEYSQQDDNVSESDAPAEEDEVSEEVEEYEEYEEYEEPEVNGDDSPPIPADESLDIPRSDEEDPAPQVKRKPGRPKQTEVTAKAKQAPKDPPKKRGRPRKNATTEDQSRPAKRAKKEYVHPSTPDAEEPEATTPKRGSDRAAISTPERKGKRPPKAGSKSQTKANAAAGASGSTKPRARGLRIMRSETPAADYGATVMRSGRTSVKPLAYWRNERAIYDTGRVYGKDRELGGIREVIRTEEISPEPRPRPRKRGGRKRRAPEAIEDDEDVQEWEEEPGYLEARVPKWDPLTNNVSEDVEEEIEIAYAPKGLELATREVKNATFLYGKTLSLPFFHSGIVDLPPGGEKRPKNSRVNHIVFWVFAGRVDVTVSENHFSIGRGGMWQVPRGNFYSLYNSYDRPARVFFAQGCYMQEDEAEVEAE